MSDSAFFDTNILVYRYDARSPSKQKIAQELADRHLRDRSLILSTQVLQEMYVNLVRLLPAPQHDLAGSIIAQWVRYGVVTVGPEQIVHAILFSRRYQVNFWDGLILSSARHAGVSRVYSEDLGHRQKYDGIEVINPFL
jgi:predicted nucleic acid-binding protein